MQRPSDPHDPDQPSPSAEPTSPSPAPAMTAPSGDASTPTPIITTGEIKPKRRLRSITKLVVVGVLTAIILVAGALMPVPYVIEEPGPTYDVLAKGSQGAMIEVDSPDATYETSGQLRLVTVRSYGGPGSTVTAGQVLLAWLNPHSEVIPEREIYPEDLTYEQLEEISKAQMTQSQSTAAAAALAELGYPVRAEVTIAGAVSDSPADGKVEDGDILRTIITPDGEEHPVNAPAVPFAIARELAPDTPITLIVERAGKTVEVASQTYLPPGSPSDLQGSKFGIYLTADVTLPFPVTIHLERVGGPSAGLMFALGIIDHLTGGDTTGGMIVAGTGSIGYDGQVQPIGGIQQKMVGAVQDGAQWFFAPRSNCDEVVGHIPDGLQVWPVSTLSEARQALANIKSGATVGHPTCEQELESRH